MTVTLANTFDGADIGNYAITGQSTAIAAITPKALTVSGITADNKTYDGTTAATVSSANATLAGLVDGDTASQWPGVRTAVRRRRMTPRIRRPCWRTSRIAFKLNF